MAKILSWQKQKPTKGVTYPISREGHGLTFVEGLGIIMFGGFGAHLLNDILVYRIKQNRWESLKTTGMQPSPRCYHSQFYDSPYLFIYGGQGGKGRSLGDMYMLNLQTLTWKRMFLQDPPSPRHQASLSSFRDNKDPFCPHRKYLFGGITTPHPEIKMYNELWVMDNSKIVDLPNDDTISGCRFVEEKTLGDRPSRRKGHTSFCYKDRLFVFGGESINFGENTTSKIYSINLVERNINSNSLSWTYFDTSFCSISARCQLSSTFLNDDHILFFGGLDNKTHIGLNDLVYFDLKNMHFSFPFTAGEHPEARYGHASCSFMSSNNKESLMLIGGINEGYCTMDIYSLVEIERKEGQFWEKIIQKTPYEEKVTKMASNFAYEARMHNLNLKDLVIEEKAKAIQVNKDEAKQRKEFEATELKWERRLQKRDDSIQKLDEENVALCKEMEALMAMIKQEQYLSQVLEEKGELIEDNFKTMQDYMNIADSSFIGIYQKVKAKKKSGKSRDMKKLLIQQKDNIERNKSAYKDSLLFLKHYYEMSQDVKEKAGTKQAQLDGELEEEIPDFKGIFKEERYDQFLTVEQEKEKQELEIKKKESEDLEIYDDNDISYKIGYPVELQRGKDDNLDYFLLDEKDDFDDSCYTLSEGEFEREESQKIEEFQDSQLEQSFQEEIVDKLIEV